VLEADATLLSKICKANFTAPCCCAFGAHPEGGKGGARAGKPLVQGARGVKEVERVTQVQENLLLERTGAQARLCRCFNTCIVKLFVCFLCVFKV